MRATLLLSRHGETDWNLAGRWQGATDIALNATGRAQARALAARLAEHAPVGAASSDLSRARETADLIASTLRIARLPSLHELRERSYGAFEGLTREECRARFPEIHANAAPGALLEPPGAERQADVGARMIAGLSSLMSDYAARDRSLVAVAHGGAIRMFLHAAFDAKVGPLSNGETFTIAWDGARFTRFDRL